MESSLAAPRSGNDHEGLKVIQRNTGVVRGPLSVARVTDDYGRRCSDGWDGFQNLRVQNGRGNLSYRDFNNGRRTTDHRQYGPAFVVN